MSFSEHVVNRRSFLKMGATGTTGLLIAFYFPGDLEQ